MTKTESYILAAASLYRKDAEALKKALLQKWGERMTQLLSTLHAPAETPVNARCSFSSKSMQWTERAVCITDTDGMPADLEKRFATVARNIVRKYHITPPWEVVRTPEDIKQMRADLTARTRELNKAIASGDLDAIKKANARCEALREKLGED